MEWNGRAAAGARRVSSTSCPEVVLILRLSIIGHISVRSVKSRWFCQPKKLGVAETHQLHWKDVRNASGAVSSVSWTNLSHFLIRVRRGVPRTFYISGSFLIHKLIFWPDRKSFKILLFTWGLENAFIWLK